MQSGTVSKAKVETNIGLHVRQVDKRHMDGNVAKVELAPNVQIGIAEIALFDGYIIENQAKIGRFFLFLRLIGSEMLHHTVEVEPSTVLLNVDLQTRKQSVFHPKAVVQ